MQTALPTACGRHPRNARGGVGRRGRRRAPARPARSTGPSRPSAGFGDIAGLQLVSRRDDAPDATAPSKAGAGARSGAAGRRRACARTRGGDPPAPTRTRRGRAQVRRCRRSSRAHGRAGRVDAVTARRRPREAPGRGVLGVGAADDREARGQGVRRGRTQAEGERPSPAPRHGRPTRTRPGRSTSAYIPNGIPV